MTGPHYLCSIRRKIIKSSSKRTPEGIGHFAHKQRMQERRCSVMVLKCEDAWMVLSGSLAPSPPHPRFVQSKQKGLFHPCNLQLQPHLEGESHYPHPHTHLGDNSSKGERSLKSTWASFWIPALPWGWIPSVTHMSCMQWEQQSLQGRLLWPWPEANTPTVPSTAPSY